MGRCFCREAAKKGCVGLAGDLGSKKSLGFKMKNGGEGGLHADKGMNKLLESRNAVGYMTAYVAEQKSAF